MAFLLIPKTRIITSSESPKSQSSDNALSLATNVATDSPVLRIYEFNLNCWPTSNGFGLKCSRSILTRSAYGFSLMPCEVAIDLSNETLDAPI